MKKMFFQAVLFGLIAFTSISQAQYNYNVNQTLPRYPLNQVGPGNQAFPQNNQNFATRDRNAIQQPQLYRVGQTQPVQQQSILNPNQPVQRVFTPGVNTQARPPYVANNYPYNLQDAPKNDQPVSPSNLPIPGHNPTPETIQPVTQGAPHIQPGHIQQGHPQLQHGQVQGHPTQIEPVPAHPHQHAPSMDYAPGAIHGNSAVGGNGCQPVYQDQFQSGYDQDGYNAGGNCGYGAGNNFAAPAMGGSFNAGFGYGYGGGCGIVPPSRWMPNNWFGSIGGLVFNRDFEDDHLLAYPVGLPLTKSLVSTDADPGAMGGLEAVFGRRFCNGTGFQVVYWGLFSEEGVATAIGGNPQTEWATANLLNYNASTVDAYLNAAAAFRIRRTNEFHNVELNFFRQTFAASNYNCNTCGGGAGYGGAGFGGAGFGGAGYGGAGFGGGRGFGANCGNGCGGGNCGVGNYAGGDCGGMGCGNAGCNSCGSTCGTGCGNGYANGCGPAMACGRGMGCGRPMRYHRPFRFDVLAGVRFFKFDENFLFRSSTVGDYSANVNDVFYDVDVDNNLVGFQVGGLIEYCLFPRWTIEGGSKFGIYGNSISQRQQIYGLAGYASANTGPYNAQDYNIRSTKTDVAFLGQFDLGVRYCINCNWNLGVGYRVVAVTGVALAPEQIPYDFTDYQDATYINSNSGLILHGTYLRMQYNY